MTRVRDLLGGDGQYPKRQRGASTRLVLTNRFLTLASNIEHYRDLFHSQFGLTRLSRKPMVSRYWGQVFSIRVVD